MLSSYCRPTSRPPNLPIKNDDGLEIDHFTHPLTPTETQNVNQEHAEETPAEVAMLLTSIRDISSNEIKADPPIMKALAGIAIPFFPDLESDEVEPNQDGLHPFKRPVPSTSMFVQHDRKKTRSISMDSPEIHSVVEQDSPPLLEWRNIRGECTSPPHGYSSYSTSHPSSSPRPRGLSSRTSSRQRVTLPSRKVNRPRAVSCAETMKDQQALLDVARSANKNKSGKPLKLILRKKFSWKNYPEVSDNVVSCIVLLSLSPSFVSSHHLRYHSSSLKNFSLPIERSISATQLSTTPCSRKSITTNSQSV